MAQKAERYKNISRIDSRKKKTHGWYVRVQFNRVMHSKFFSDKRYDGREHALTAAIEYRNQIEKEIGKPRTERTVVGVRPKNGTGVVGVYRRMKSNGKIAGSYSDVYEVAWSPEPNVVQRTSVSITKHGKEEAFRLACEIRKEKERKYYGGEIKPHRQRKTA